MGNKSKYTKPRGRSVEGFGFCGLGTEDWRLRTEGTLRERVKNERKCRDAEAEMKNARGRKTEMLPTAIRMLNSSNNNNNNSNNNKQMKYKK